MIDPQADSLNKIIHKGNNAIYSLLSKKGLAIFFPKKGILNQSAQAQGCKINATIGIAKNDDGSPLNLVSISQNIKLSPNVIFPYAPGTGVADLRKIWQAGIIKKNPLISEKNISLPIVTAGVTHGIYILAYLFINQGDTLITPDLYWENYDLIFKNTFGAIIKTFPAFNDQGFNLQGLEKCIFAPGKKKVLILNFPNNPTGFTPSEREVKKIVAILHKAAIKGKKILVITDDAYFGLVYEKGIIQQSIFAYLANLHKNILCAKVDGATKEDYVWGFRIGFITFGIKGGDSNLYNALGEKTAGVIRSTISNAPLISQSLLLHAYQSPRYDLEKKKNYQLLKERFEEVKRILAENKHYTEEFIAYPFNSGYFMCVKLLHSKAEDVRQILLNNYSIGLITFGNNLRISYSSVALKKLPIIFEKLYQACREANDKIHKNLNADTLIKHALQRKEAILSKSGALTVKTGKYTGRSPDDRFIVDDQHVHNLVNWGKVNVAISEDTFNNLYQKVNNYLTKLKQLYVFDGIAGADPKYAIKVRVICEFAYQNLFIRHMLLKPLEKMLIDYMPDFTILAAPGFKADPSRDKTHSEAFIIINFSKKIVLIGGTQYAGEIKKSVFTIMNYLLPQKGVLPMHCSANIGKNNDTAVFFGLSGTGKTTLSADPKRKLIGDDEHGWSENGIFNFEAGCYAKCINLSKKSEPYIYNAIKYGAICENVVLNLKTLEYDFTDGTLTENTRVTFPLDYIPGSVSSGLGTHPKSIIFLTADAFGVLPPVAKLSTKGAIYHFLSGYTSKLAGTERGIIEPKATFSTLFGEPFMPLNPLIYADLFEKYVKKYRPSIFLINTGWINGAYGVGKRISIEYTRTIVSAALDGLLDKADYRQDKIFNLSVPRSLNGVPKDILNPAQSWQNKKEYAQKATELAKLFQKNFEKYTGASKQLIAAGPHG